MEPSTAFDFNRISTKINSKSEEILILLDQCQMQCIIPSVSAFEEQYSIRYKSPTWQSPDDSASAPTTTELSEAFKILDKTAPCFPKIPRKHTTQSSSHKQNSSKRNELLLSSSAVSNTSLAKFNVNDVATITKRLLKGCKDRNERFRETLKKATASSCSVQHQHQDAVQDMRRALDDLEKLIPRGLDASVPMFGADEEQAMSMFREEIDALVCIQENKDIYPIVEMPDDPDLDFISKLTGELLRL